jgi:2-oxoglutarate ferredoxin oxidoreductase subunit beta
MTADPHRFDMPGADVAWCPGCGNFAILTALKQALDVLDIDPRRLVLVSGIGQAAKTPHYLRANVFNGLHGRALPAATGIKATNPRLTVVVTSGDGDMYGEGGNHFLHAVRRNPDITAIVHDNMVYGLTKGQASPTSMIGFKTPLQPGGVAEEPFNPLATAITLGATFVARAFAGDIAGTRDIVVAAVRHRGFALVDVLQPCVTFNKLNTYPWFREHTRTLGAEHDPGDRTKALAMALDMETLPLGIIYAAPGRPVFEETLETYRRDPAPLPERTPDRRARLGQLLER